MNAVRDVKPIYNDMLVVCDHGWPVEIADCPQCHPKPAAPIPQGVHELDRWNCETCGTQGNWFDDCRVCFKRRPGMLR